MTRLLPGPAPLAEGSYWLPCSLRTPGVARQRLRTLLDGVPGGDRLIEVGLLLLSELVTNAVTHGRVPGRLIRVRLTAEPGSLRIEVHDPDPRQPTSLSDEGVGEAGRGLLLVERLATAWGCAPRPGGVGKAVWCVVSATTAGDLR